MALAGVQALALARARPALAEAARRAAAAVAAQVGAERAVEVDQACAGQDVAPVVLTVANRLPAAEEIAAKVAPGCELRGVRLVAVKPAVPSDARVLAENALGLPARRSRRSRSPSAPGA